VYFYFPSNYLADEYFFIYSVLLGMNYQSVFTCGAANTIANGLHWINGSTIETSCVVYSLHNLISIVDLKSNSIVCTLRGSTGLITALSSALIGDVHCLVAACDDGTVKLWTRKSESPITEWEGSSSNFVGLESATSALSVLNIDNFLMIAASDSKGTVAVWTCNPSANFYAELFSKFRMPVAQMSKSLCLSTLPSGSCSVQSGVVALFIGSVDSRVHIYTTTLNHLKNSTEQKMRKFNFSGAVFGHEEWVTCFSSFIVDEKSMMLASGSQDTKIRLWNIKAQIQSGVQAQAAQHQQVSENLEVELEVDGDDAVEGDIIQSTLEDEELESEARLQFSVDSTLYSVLLESLLVGHEDWVTSVRWMPALAASSNYSSSSGDNSSDSGASAGHQYRLFSTSMDRNMVIWAPDEAAGGVWVPSVRMGDIGGALGGSIGGNLLGFVDGCVSPDGNSLLAVGYGGSFHLWSHRSEAEGMQQGGSWVPVPFFSGHFGAVTDLCWSEGNDLLTGSYLITASLDQTCRIFAPVLPEVMKTNAMLASSAVEGLSIHENPCTNRVWKEISRPEIHGYELNCVVAAPLVSGCGVAPSPTHVLLTAGEEKLIRIFDAPYSVLRGLKMLCGIEANATVTAGDADSNMR
jgi:elongator complex protein 2